jgi:transcriptional regulator with XRE-family HTH domain
MQESNTTSLGQRLRQKRQLLNWSQKRLAEAIGATSMSVNRWEHDKAIPQLYYREQLCRVFNTPAETLFGVFNSDEYSTRLFRSCWAVSLPRNPFFTGRELILSDLYEKFHRGSTMSLIQAQALSGLGGMGKTQTVLEYAYRYANDYQAVLWLRASSHEVLLDDLVALADVLSFLEPPNRESRSAVQIIKQWLNERTQWLLILDNVEDPLLIQDLLPSHPVGHILLTTRSSITGAAARSINLPPMDLEEGKLFLLRRAKYIDPEADLKDATVEECRTAECITRLVGGLPLALDQAGSYIEETGCNLSDYLKYYQQSCEVLLARQNRSWANYSHSVYTTFSLCYQQVERVDPAAAALMCLCTFLYSEAIPEKIILEGACELGSVLEPVARDPLRFNEALAVLRLNSLVYRNPHLRTLTMHCLVQEVVKQHLDQQMQRTWAERAIRIVHKTCVKFMALLFTFGWKQELPHEYIEPAFLMCVTHIEQWEMTSKEAAELLYFAGVYFLERQREKVAMPLLCRAQALCERRGDSPFLPPKQILEEYQLLLNLARSTGNA